MDLIERYLNAVKPFLPPDQRDDIVKELSANLHEEADEREAELGRPLSDSELESILTAHGHPLTAAGRYQTNQGGLTFGRQLISPMLFPLYLRALWILIAFGTLIHIGVLVALGVSGVSINSGDIVNSFFTQFFVQFAVVTILFCVADRILPATPWRDLSAGIAPAARPPRRARDRVSLVESIAQIVALIAVAIWLQVVYTHPESLVGSIGTTYRLGPAWSYVVFPTAAIFAANLIQSIINLARPDWTSLRAVTRALTDLAGLAILLYLIFAGADNLVIFAHPGAGDPRTLQIINQWVEYSLAPTALAFLIAAGIDFWRLRASLNWRSWLPGAA
jgi:hypothetical protein